jgi:hypothetical protein
LYLLAQLAANRSIILSDQEKHLFTHPLHLLLSHFLIMFHLNLQKGIIEKEGERTYKHLVFVLNHISGTSDGVAVSWPLEPILRL